VFEEITRNFSGNELNMLVEFLSSVRFKGMILMTTNDGHILPDAMKDRPGRVLYFINYGYMDLNSARGLIRDKLKHKKYKKKLLSFFSKGVTYDEAITLIEIINELGGMVDDIDVMLKDLNSSLADNGKKYVVEYIRDIKTGKYVEFSSPYYDINKPYVTGPEWGVYTVNVIIKDDITGTYNETTIDLFTSF